MGSNPPSDQRRCGCNPAYIHDNSGAASEESGSTRPALSPVEAVFYRGQQDYFSYVEHTVMTGSLSTQSLVGEGVCWHQWRLRKPYRVEYFNFFSSSDLIRAARALKTNIVVGRQGKTGMYKILFDPRVVLWEKNFPTRYICMCDDDKAYIVDNRMTTINIEFCETGYTPVEPFEIAGHKNPFTKLPNNKLLCQEIGRRFFSDITVYTQMRSREFKQSKYKSGSRPPLFELTFAKCPGEKRGDMHLILELVQQDTSSQPDIRALLLHSVPKVGRLEAKAHSSVGEEIRNLKRKAQESPNVSEEPKKKKALLYRKVNHSCFAKDCKFCTEVVPKLEKARGMDRNKEGTSPIFNPFAIQKNLEISQRIKASGLYQLLPSVEVKLQQARLVSLSGFDIESLSQFSDFSQPLHKTGVSTITPGEPKGVQKCGVQTPYLIGTSIFATGSRVEDPKLGDLETTFFEVPSREGVPSRADVAGMVDKFLTWLFKKAEERKAEKKELLADEIGFVSKLCDSLEQAYKERNPGDKKTPSASTTFLGRLLSQLEGVVSDMFIVGFNSSR